MYDIAAVRAERDAQRTDKPFEFTLDGRTWQMPNPKDMPAEWFTWQLADYVRNAPRVFLPAGPDADKAPAFPIDQLTTADLDALVSAWIGSSVGESTPPAS